MGKRREVIIGSEEEVFSKKTPVPKPTPKSKKEKLKKEKPKEGAEETKKPVLETNIQKSELQKIKPQKTRSKRYQNIKQKIVSKIYNLDEAIDLIKQGSGVKFDESVELHIKLGIDSKKAEHSVRGFVDFPHRLGQQKKIVVFASGDKEKEAKAAGADMVGLDELIKKIEQGFLDFDVVIATPEAMAQVSKVAKILGPKGLMPNPKSGTITQKPSDLIKAIRRGRVEFKMDPEGNLHQVVGKVSQSKKELIENIKTYIEAVIGARPPSFKGEYIKSITICSSMGPGVRIQIPR